MIWSIVKADVKKKPFKNTEDVQQVVLMTYSKITPEVVRNCWKHVEDQEKKVFPSSSFTKKHMIFL